MPEKKFYRSKKFWAAVVATIIGLCKAFGVEADLEYAIYPLMAYLLSQGIADLGRHRL